MGRILNGSHWPNQRPYNIEQCLRAAPGCVTVLHHQLVNDPLLGGRTADDENCNVFGKLRLGFAPQGIPPAPDRLIHIRCYHPNWTTLDPVRYAESIVGVLADWRGSRDQADARLNLWDDPLVAVSPCNEPNLHYECGDPDPGHQPQYQSVEHYIRLARWQLAWLRRVDQLVPNRRALLCTGALADGHEPPGYAPDGEYGIPAIRDMLQAFDLVGIHPYAILHEQPQSGATGKLAFWYMLRPFRPARLKDASDPGGVVSQYPTLTYLVSETGTFTHSDKGRTAETWRELAAFYRACEASGRVVGVTPFVWNSDGAHPQNVIWPNEELRSILEHAPLYPSTVTLPVRGARPTPPPPPPPPPSAFEPNPGGYSVGDGFLAEARRRRVQLTSDEVYFQGPRGALSLAVTGEGLLVWSQAGGVKFARFE